MAQLLEDTSGAIVEMQFDPPERLSKMAVVAAEQKMAWPDSGPDMPVPDRLPRQLIERYIRSAVRRAMTEQMSDGRWYAEITLLPGIWADGDTEAAALAELESVTEDWILLKIEDHDRDLPVLETLDLNHL